MKLFLASEIKNPKTIKKLEDYVGGFKGKSIAYIPTAANGEGWHSWKGGGTWNTFQSLGAKITVIQLEEYQDKDPADELMDKDIIFFAGGYTGYLLYWMRRTQLNKKIKDILNNGSLYVGSSAGSMVTGKDIEFCEWYIGENEAGAACIPGLGLVDFNFYPHYKDDLFDEIKEKFKGNKIYLVKDGDALIIEDEKIEVFGEEKLIIK
jgi:dipeptidase E